MSIIDIGGQVREGEELNVVAVENWLKQQGIALLGEVKVTQYTGGASIGLIVYSMTMSI